jgi:hypothetical protein
MISLYTNLCLEGGPFERGLGGGTCVVGCACVGTEESTALIGVDDDDDPPTVLLWYRTDERRLCELVIRDTIDLLLSRKVARL